MSDNFDDDFDDIEDIEVAYNPEYYKLRIESFKYCYDKFTNIKVTFYGGDEVEGKIKMYSEDEFMIVIPVNDNINEYIVKTYPMSEVRLTEYRDIGSDNINTLIDSFNQNR
jgi:hypothetical protein